MIRGDKSKEENKLMPVTDMYEHFYQQDMYEHGFNYGSNAGVDLMPITDMQHPLHKHNFPVTDDNLRLDLNQLYPEQDPLLDTNTNDMSTSMFNMYGHGFSNPEWNLDELPSHAHKTGLSDSLASDHFNNLVDTKEGTNRFNDELVTSSGPFSRKFDGGFLSLGFGNSVEIRSENGINCNVCTGEPHRAILPNSDRFNDQKAIGRYSNPAHQIFDRFSTSQNNFNNHFRSDYGSDTCPVSNQFYALQKPLPDFLREYPKCSQESPWNFSYGGDTLGANWNHQKGFCSDLATSSELFSCGSTSGLADIGNIFPSSLGLEPGKPSVITTKPNKNQFVMPHMATIESFSLEPSIVCPATWPRGSCTKQENTGESPTFVSVTAQAANQKAPLPKRELVQPELVQPDGKLISHAKDDTLGSSSRKRSANQPPPSAPRVQRKKIPVTSPVPRGWSTKGQSDPWELKNRKTDQSLVMPPVPSPSLFAPIAAPQTVLPSIDRKVDFTIPVSPKNQHTNTTAPSLIVPPFSDSPTFAQMPLPVHWVELKTTVPSISNPTSASFAAPNIPPPVVRTSPSIPTVAQVPHVPDSPPRIKWKDPDEFPPPMGEKCMICKRDLLFTAEGPVSQPAIPPAAAVLPCGHTFHGHCLHIITPQDQSTSPPCIPCAIGEY